MFARKTPEQQQREQKRELRQSERDLERDRRELDRQEAALKVQIQKYAKQGDRAAAATLAKQLVRVRAQRTRSVQTSARVTAVGSQTVAMQSNAKLAGAMKGAGAAMHVANQQVSLQDMRKTAQQFERESAQMEMKGELMDDAIESMMGGSDEEGEMDDVMNQVFDEIGISIGQKLASPSTAPIGGRAAARERGEDDLEARLKMLEDAP